MAQPTEDAHPYRMTRSRSADQVAADAELGEWQGSAAMAQSSFLRWPGVVLVVAGFAVMVPWLRSVLLGNAFEGVGLLLVGAVLVAVGLLAVARQRRLERTSGHVQLYSQGIALPRPGGWLAVPDRRFRVLVEGTFQSDGHSEDAVPLSVRVGREVWDPVDVPEGVRRLLRKTAWRAYDAQRPLVFAAFDRGDPVRFDGLVVSVNGLQNAAGQVRRWREIDGLVLEPNGDLTVRHHGLGPESFSETFAEASSISNLPLAMELISRARGQATI